MVCVPTRIKFNSALFAAAFGVEEQNRSLHRAKPWTHAAVSFPTATRARPSGATDPSLSARAPLTTSSDSSRLLEDEARNLMIFKRKPFPIYSEACKAFMSFRLDITSNRSEQFDLVWTRRLK